MMPHILFVIDSTDMVEAIKFSVRNRLLRQFICLCFMLVLISAGGADVEGATLVGRTAGNTSVSSTGAATYSIPITVPAGQNNLRPNIALTYNSRAGSGLAGVGWTVSGLSQIRRCGLSIALDGYFEGVDYSKDDRYCLDGQPLILVSAGDYWAADQEFRTEVHNYAKVMSFGSVGSGEGVSPQYFEVQQPNGLIYRYGYTADARVEAPGNSDSAVSAWALDSIRDPFDMRIFFIYDEVTSTGEFRPSEVLWTAQGESYTTAKYRIRFVYEARPADDVRTGYESDSIWTRNKRLQAIEYEYDSGSGFGRVHGYALAYESSTGSTKRSKLDTVTQCGPTDCLPATDVNWQIGQDGYGSELTGPTIPGYADAVFVDLNTSNGFGGVDMVVPENGWWSWYNSSSDGNLSAGLTVAQVYGTAGAHSFREFTGTGRAGLMAEGADGDWHIYYLGCINHSSGIYFCDIDTGMSVAQNSLVGALDVNGDGLTDLLSTRSGTTYLRINTGGALAAEKTTNVSFGSGAEFYRAINGVTDVNGDGREDLIVKSSYQQQEPCGPSGCQSYQMVTASISYWDSTTGKDDFQPANDAIAFVLGGLITQVFPVEINGDGLTDFIFREGAGYWKTTLSTGSNFTTAQTATGITAVDSVGDVDNDGRFDLVSPCVGGTTWCAYTSDGSGYDSSRSTELGGPNPAQVGRMELQDTSGDGYAELLAVKTTSPANGLKIRVHDGPRADLVTSITDGLGNVDSLSHSHEYILHGGIVDVVNQFTAPNGRNWTYVFYSGVVDTNGRGFLGFSSSKVTDSVDGTWVWTNFRQDFPYIGRPDLVTRYQADNKKIFESDPSWDSKQVTVNGDNYYFVHLKESGVVGGTPSSITTEYEVDPDGGSNGAEVRTTKRHVLYDFTHGAIKQDVTAVDSSAHSTSFTITVDTSFWSFAASTLCLGFPSQIDVTRSDSTAAPITRTRQATYTDKCQTATQRIGPFGSPAQQQLVAFAYDGNGKVTSVTRDAGDGSLPDRVTTFGWDAAGYRQTSITSVIDAPDTNLTTQQSWDYGLGLMDSKTDPRGNSVSWIYDDFGRMKQSTLPGPAITTVSYQNCTTCFIGTAAYKVRSDGPATGAWSESYHDAFGRVVGSASVLVDGRETRQITTYDLQGRVISQTLPYIDGDSTFNSTYTYDLLGRTKQVNRPISEGSPTGALTNWTYDRLSVTVQDAELNSTIYQNDAAGRLISVVDALSNTASYSYWPHGEISQITTDDTITMTYDALGNPSTVDDPDSGTWTYVYNVFGELVQQSDDKSTPNVMTQNYDQFGRLNQRIEPEGTSTWSYHQSGNGLGLLNNVTGPTDLGGAGFNEQFSYDTLGRMTSVTTTIDSYAHTTDYVYNPVGQLTSMTYPAYPLYSGWFARPQFSYAYSNGHLTTIVDERGQLPIYSVQNQDALGRATLTTSGSGQSAVDQQITFDQATGRVKQIQAGPSSGSTVQDYSYLWDKVGNLVQRTDNNQGIASETLAYDKLNRLTTVTTASGQTSLTYTLNGNGNIATKSDVGTYTYGENGAGPHAVTSISGTRSNTYHYDANGNMDCRGAATSACIGGDKITWYSFNKPIQIDYGTEYARFVYGPGRQRIKQAYDIGGVTRNTHYAGGHFEWDRRGNQYRYRSTVFANGQAVYWIKEQILDDGCTISPSSVSHSMFRDHQGSVDRMAADGSGSDKSYSFDAFGKRRNVTGWTADTNDILLDTDHMTKRGYTGHEHLDNVKLVHMNGRVQDPIIGRMLSPDPVLGSLRNPQSLNRYSYVINNPLSLTDPSGFMPAPGYDFETNISILESAISSYRSNLRAWVSGCRNNRGCSGRSPSVAGITSAANSMAGVNPALSIPATSQFLGRGYDPDAVEAANKANEEAFAEWASQVAEVRGEGPEAVAWVLDNVSDSADVFFVPAGAVNESTQAGLILGVVGGATAGVGDTDSIGVVANRNGFVGFESNLRDVSKSRNERVKWDGFLFESERFHGAALDADIGGFIGGGNIDNLRQADIADIELFAYTSLPLSIWIVRGEGVFGVALTLGVGTGISLTGVD